MTDEYERYWELRIKHDADLEVNVGEVECEQDAVALEESK